MNLSQTRRLINSPSNFFEFLQKRSAAIFTLIIFLALLSFEAFNYSTTDYALRDLLGELGFAGIRWSTILALAFSGMDFAGIARLFSLQTEGKEKNENWYLLGAWFIAATMNAGLTWWGIAMAIYNHPVQSIIVVDPMTIVRVVPIFVASMVWVLRILIIGMLVTSVNRLLSQEKNAVPKPRPAQPFGFKVPPPMPGSAAGFVRKPMPPSAANEKKLPEAYIPFDSRQ